MRFLLLFLAFSVSGMAQTSYRTTPYKVKKISTFDPKTAEPSKYDARLYSLEAPSPGGDGYKDFLLRQKLRVEKDHPRKASPYKNTSRATAGDPIVLDSFQLYWNGPNGKTPLGGGNPNDNSLAFSDKYLIASWNSRIFFYDLQADTPLINPAIGWTFLTFQEFADTIPLASAFDPKVLYDAEEDRFMLLFLDVDRNDRNNTTRTIMGFSTSGNPMDPWNIYEIDGNPLKNGTWSDYPQVAFTQDELFFTINLLTGGDWVGDFQRTLIWQIDKNSGFRGDANLTTVLWDSIYHEGQALRYLHPVDYGTQIREKEMYFLSNRSIPVNPEDTISYSYDSLFVVKIDNTIASGQAKLTLNKAKASSRTHTSPLALQPSGGKKFWTNDSRILGAFINAGEIQFVGNTLDTTNGQSGVFHGIANSIDGQMTVQMNILSHDTLDFGFPAISYMGLHVGDQSSLIAFNHSSPYDFAGYSCYYYNGDGNYSNLKRVVTGSNYVFTNSYPTSERWGDYFGLQRDYTQGHCAWLLGYHGNSNNSSGMYLAKVKGPGNFASVDESPKTRNLKVYPNPGSNRIYVELEVETASVLDFVLYNQAGQEVDHLLTHYAKSGMSQFSFDAYTLQAGIYYLKVRSGDEIISTEKLIIQ